MPSNSEFNAYQHGSVATRGSDVPHSVWATGQHESDRHLSQAYQLDHHNGCQLHPSESAGHEGFIESATAESCICPVVRLTIVLRAQKQKAASVLFSEGVQGRSSVHVEDIIVSGLGNSSSSNSSNSILDEALHAP